MADHTAIEWTDATWNPITGCAVVSPGCTNCYAMRLAGTRLAHHPSRAALTRETKAGPVWTGEVRLNRDWLDQPLKWRRPRRIFVCAHGDLFAEGVPDEWLDKVFAVMALAPQHTFQVLTKRPARMRAYMLEQWQGTPARAISLGHGETLHIPAGGPTGRRIQIEEACEPLLERFGLVDTTKDHLWTDEGACKAMQWQWPLHNVWLGVSAEDQRRADERIPDLLATPAAVRFVSAEPLLGPINLRRIRIATDHHTILDALDGYAIADSIAGSGQERAMLDWIIVGGESGRGARPMHPDWARQIRDACATAGTAFFFKQWGNYLPGGQTMANGKVWAHDTNLCAAKSLAGRFLDGVEHNAMPEVRR